MNTQQIIFDCKVDCPVIKIRRAEKGATVPFMEGRTYHDAVRAGTPGDFHIAYGSGSCIFPKYNGADGVQGWCLLKIER